MRWSYFLHNVHPKFKTKPLLLLKIQSSTNQKPTQSIQREEAQLNEYPILSYPILSYPILSYPILITHFPEVVLTLILRSLSPSIKRSLYKVFPFRILFSFLLQSTWAAYLFHLSLTIFSLRNYDRPLHTTLCKMEAHWLLTVFLFNKCSHKANKKLYLNSYNLQFTLMIEVLVHNIYCHTAQIPEPWKTRT